MSNYEVIDIPNKKNDILNNYFPNDLSNIINEYIELSNEKKVFKEVLEDILRVGSCVDYLKERGFDTYGDIKENIIYSINYRCIDECPFMCDDDDDNDCRSCEMLEKYRIDKYGYCECFRVGCKVCPKLYMFNVDDCYTTIDVC